MSTYMTLLMIQFAATWMMVGIIWFVQLVHYPLYTRIKEGFIEYERSNVKRTLFFVGPVMLIEAISAIFLIGITKNAILLKLAAANLILLIFIWLATLVFHLYQHHKLSLRFSKRMVHMLVASNWVRTFFWSLKGLVLIGMAVLS